jgi:4-hydroxy-tetrahydrodipicolinate reductase
MRIGLFGYGKMGKAIEAAAQEHGHEIVWRIARENRDRFSPDELRQADVCIEFSRPDAAYDNVMMCLEAGIPVVSGTTGWADRLPEARAYCQERGGAFLWASNFSVGVNLFFALNRYFGRLMDARPEYDPSVAEVHHIHKLDAPSGTALTLTHDLLALLDRKSNWVLHPDPPGERDIPITAFREDEEPGTHIVRWDSPADTITLEHRAHSRAGFAAGALLAARWLQGKKGTFGMPDVLGLAEGQ